jgi:transcriptional regulator with XRE-family HTH domain
MGRVIAPEAVELRRWRRERCISQKELAQRLGVATTTLTEFETGMYRLRPAADGRARLPKGWDALLATLYATWTPLAMSKKARARLANRIRERGLADPRQLWIPGMKPPEPPFGVEL